MKRYFLFCYVCFSTIKSLLQMLGNQKLWNKEKQKKFDHCEDRTNGVWIVSSSRREKFWALSSRFQKPWLGVHLVKSCWREHIVGLYKLDEGLLHCWCYDTYSFLVVSIFHRKEKKTIYKRYCLEEGALKTTRIGYHLDGGALSWIIFYKMVDTVLWVTRMKNK